MKNETYAGRYVPDIIKSRKRERSKCCLTCRWKAVTDKIEHEDHTDGIYCLQDGVTVFSWQVCSDWADFKEKEISEK